MARKPRLQPRKIPSQDRGRATLDAICAAAAQVLREEGFERTNVNRVAARAGVSVGSLYQYFPSKEALVAAVAARLTERMIDAFGEDLASLATAPFDDAVRGVVARALRAFAVDPRLRRVIVTEVPRGESFVATRDFDAAVRTIVVAWLEHHRERVRPTDLALAARILFVAVEEIAARFSLEEPERLADPALASELGDLVLGYLRRPGSS